jgi:hypothetical protein
VSLGVQISLLSSSPQELLSNQAAVDKGQKAARDKERRLPQVLLLVHPFVAVHRGGEW